MNYYEKKMFFEHYVRKYYKCALEAEKKYQEHLDNYRYDFKKLALYGLKNGESILKEYTKIAIIDLKNLFIKDVSEEYFIKTYLCDYYPFKDNCIKIKETYEDIRNYEKELSNNIPNNHNTSNIKFYPKNISSISTSLGLNILANTGYMFSIAKDTFKLRMYLDSEMQKLLNQIKKSNILLESFSKSVFNIFRAFFKCIEDKLGYKINDIYTDGLLMSELPRILNSTDDEIAIKSCINQLTQKSKDRQKSIQKKESRERIILTIALIVIGIAIIIRDLSQ